MKKLLLLCALICGVTLQSQAKIWYFHFKLGVGAKWQVTSGDCSDGNGLCLSVGSISLNGDISHDDLTGDVWIDIPNASEVYHELGASVFFDEDTAIDPALSAQIGFGAGVVRIIGGVYNVTETADAKTIHFNCYYTE